MQQGNLRGSSCFAVCRHPVDDFDQVEPVRCGLGQGQPGQRHDPPVAQAHAVTDPACPVRIAHPVLQLVG